MNSNIDIQPAQCGCDGKTTPPSLDELIFALSRRCEHRVEPWKKLIDFNTNSGVVAAPLNKLIAIVLDTIADLMNSGQDAFHINLYGFAYATPREGNDKFAALTFEGGEPILLWDQCPKNLNGFHGALPVHLWSLVSLFD